MKMVAELDNFWHNYLVTPTIAGAIIIPPYIKQWLNYVDPHIIESRWRIFRWKRDQDKKKFWDWDARMQHLPPADRPWMMGSVVRAAEHPGDVLYVIPIVWAMEIMAEEALG